LAFTNTTPLPIREILGNDIDLNAKSGQLMISGKLPKIEILFSNLNSEQILFNQKLQNILTSANQTIALEEVQEKNQISNQLNTKNIYTRSELEALTGNSKTSMVRLLAKWSEEELILKNGSGKNINYKLTPSLVEKLKNTEAHI